MTADFNGFGEAFEQLREAMGGEEPPGGRKTPVWVKYVDVKAGDELPEILETGFKMHAAVTGEILIKDCFVGKDLKDEQIKEMVEDVHSKIPFIYNDKTYNTNIGLNHNTFVLVTRSDDRVSFTAHTFDEGILTYIKNVVEFQES